MLCIYILQRTWINISNSRCQDPKNLKGFLFICIPVHRRVNLVWSLAFILLCLDPILWHLLIVMYRDIACFFLVSHCNESQESCRSTIMRELMWQYTKHYISQERSNNRGIIWYRMNRVKLSDLWRQVYFWHCQRS